MHKHFFNSEQGVQVGNKLRIACAMWIPMRKDSIEALNEKKEKVIEVTRKSRISRIAGASAGIVGGVVSIVGFGLIPVTLGGSLVIAGVGGGIALLGGLTSLGATLADLIISNRELKNAQELLTIDKQLCQVINNLQIELANITHRLATQLPNQDKENITIALLSAGQSVTRVSTIFARIGVDAAQVAELGGIAAIDGGIMVLRIASAATKGIAIAGGIVTALVLPLDIYELVINAYRLRNNRDNNVSKWIQDQLDIMVDQQQSVQELLARVNRPQQ